MLNFLLELLEVLAVLEDLLHQVTLLFLLCLLFDFLELSPCFFVHLKCWRLELRAWVMRALKLLCQGVELLLIALQLRKEIVHLLFFLQYPLVHVVVPVPFEGCLRVLEAAANGLLEAPRGLNSV